MEERVLHTSEVQPLLADCLYRFSPRCADTHLVNPISWRFLQPCFRWTAAACAHPPKGHTLHNVSLCDTTGARGAGPTVIIRIGRAVPASLDFQTSDQHQALIRLTRTRSAVKPYVPYSKRPLTIVLDLQRNLCSLSDSIIL
jgi:hypothetical protein